MITTLGTQSINDALPEDLRKEAHVLDKSGIHKLMQELAAKHPEKYKDVLQGLNDVGRKTLYDEGASLSLSALGRSEAKEQMLAPVRKKLDQIINDRSLNDQQQQDAIINTLLPVGGPLTDALMAEAKQEKNPYHLQVVSGSRGKKSDYNSLRGAELLTSDQNNKIIPIPIMNSYADGLDPAEYFAGLYSQRKGMIGVKFATADAGFLNKQLVNATHRIVVDKEHAPQTRLPVALPVKGSDPDNVGAILAKDFGPHKAGSTITPSMVHEFGDDEILIHSPMTEHTPDGGISRMAAGKRDRRDASAIGDNIGIPAAQAIGEKLSQGMLGSKHSAAQAKVKASREGFEYLNRLIQAPETFPEAGSLAEEDGTVKSVEAAPQGGNYVNMGEKQYYIPTGLKPVVKAGDQLEEGDDLSDGIPHPAELVKHRGIGEGRRVYMGLLKEALDNSNIAAHRRNLEAVTAGLINWTKITNPDGLNGHLPDDIVSYNSLAHDYSPRPDATVKPPTEAIGHYMEEPALHYTIGTKVNRKVAANMKQHGIQNVTVHKEPPGFEPYMQRGMLAIHDDPDWQTQLSGFYTTDAFENSVNRGAYSNPHGTSFVPGLAEGTNFGADLTSTGHYA